MSLKRKKGDGTVCKRKDGRYEAAAYVHTPKGKRRVRRYFRTRSEAEAALVDLRNLNNSGLMTDTRQQKLGDYLEHYLSISKATLRPSTYQGYEAIVRLYLKPGLGNKPIVKLSVTDIQSHLDDQLRLGASPRTVQKQRLVLSATLKRAEQEELLVRNVARLAKIPPYHPKEIIPWTKTQLKHFLSFAKDDRLYPVFVVLAYYGLRESEALGLTWQNIDADKKEVKIRQQLLYYNGAFQYADLKTRAAQRVLPLFVEVHEVLQNIKRTNDGPMPDLIFKSINGNPIDRRGLLRAFKRLSKEADLPVITLHTIRHITATNLKDMGLSATDAKYILGHANISTTLQIYTHSSLPERNLILSKYAQLLA